MVHLFGCNRTWDVIQNKRKRNMKALSCTNFAVKVQFGEG